MKEKSIKGITLVALVITIVILLILAGISIQAITNTGLFENAKRAAEESKYANAEEKVKMAVMASYDENASLNKDLLKKSLNKIDGINPKVTEVTWVEGRRTGTVTGVVDVLSFDLTEILLETDQGMLMIRGSDLHVNRLTLEKGEVDVEGKIDSLTYSDSVAKPTGTSILSRLFG